MKNLHVGIFILSAALLTLGLEEKTSAFDPSRLKFHHLTVDKSIPVNTVCSITQDADGNMWFGTEYGPVSFDGYNTSIYDLGQMENIADNNGHIRYAVFSCPDGSVWASSQGLFKFNPDKNAFDRIEAFPPQDIYDFHVLDGVAYVSAKDGMYSFSILENTDDIIPVHLSYLPALKICSGKNILYIGTKDNRIYTFCPETSEFKLLVTLDTEFHISQIMLSDSLWITTDGGGLYEYTLDGFCLHHYLMDKKNEQALCSNHIRGISADLSGNLWLPTSDGLSILDTNSGKFSSVICDRNNPFSLSHNSLCSVFCDRNGILWLGAAIKGVEFCNLQELPFKTVSTKEFNEFYITDHIAEDSDGSIWFGTTRLGAFHYFPDSGRMERISLTDTEDVLNEVSCFNMNLDNEHIYMGTARNGLLVYDRSKKTLKKCCDELISANVGFLLTDKACDALWLYAHGDVFVYYPELDTLVLSVPEKVISKPDILLSDATEIVWMKRFEKDVYRIRLSGAAEFKPRHTVLDSLTQLDKINGVKTIDNSMFLFTNRGLYRYQQGEEQYWNSLDGLSSDYVKSVEQDSLGRLWVSSIYGLNCIDPSKGTISKYFQENGLPDDEFRKNSSLFASDGTMYFGTPKGLVCFRPEKTQREIPSYTPRVAFASIGDEKRACRKLLNLGPDEDSFSLFFSVPNYSSYGKDSFSYRLLPIARNWIPAQSNSVNITGLHHGKYTLELKSVNANGQVSENIFSLPIIVRPHWFQCILAKIVYAILAVALLYMAFRKLREYLRKKMKERAENARLAAAKALENNKTRFYSSHLLGDVDSAFLSKAINVVEQHITDKNFSVDKFAYEMCMSRSNLHIRLISTTGLSATHFINRVRLEKAISILSEKKLPVAKVSEMVGFSSPSYFVKLFRKYTGSTPGRIFKLSL